MNDKKDQLISYIRYLIYNYEDCNLAIFNHSLLLELNLLLDNTINNDDADLDDIEYKSTNIAKMINKLYDDNIKKIQL